jgi:hypothetical protein
VTDEAGPRVEGDEIPEIVRSTPPPKGFEAFAVAMASVAQQPQQVFGVALDPLRPAEIITPSGGAWTPPHCPLCFSLIQAVRQNHLRDMLFECLYDGYTAVFRVGPQRWELRPAPTGPQDWTPPLFGNEPPTGWVPPTSGVSYDQAVGMVPNRPDVPKPDGPPPERVNPAPVRTPAPVSAPQPAVEAQWLTLVEAAAVTGKTVNDLYKLVRKGAVPSRKSERGLVLIDVDAVERADG